MRRTAALCLTLTLAACGDADPGPQAPPPASPPVAAAPKPATPEVKLPSPPAADPTVVPVYYGREEHEDACGGAGDIVSAGTHAGYAKVRSGPGRQFAVIDSLPVGSSIIFCDSPPNTGAHDKWTPVVYEPLGEAGKDMDCGTGSPVAKYQAYPGPCKSGWVVSESARVLAG
jgi:hypothetical protein